MRKGGDFRRQDVQEDIFNDFVGGCREIYEYFLKPPKITAKKRTFRIVIILLYGYYESMTLNLSTMDALLSIMISKQTMHGFLQQVQSLVIHADMLTSFGTRRTMQRKLENI